MRGVVTELATAQVDGPPASSSRAVPPVRGVCGRREGGGRRAKCVPRLRPWLRVLGALGVVVLLGAHLGTGPVLDGLRAIAPGSVLAALGIGLLTTVVSAWRWCLVARGLGLPLSLPGAVADCYRALFLNSVLPAGVLGDVHRAVSHGRRSGDVGRGVRAVALERAAGLVVLLVVAVAVLLARPNLLAAAAGALVPDGGTVGLLAVLVAALGLGIAVLRSPLGARIRAALRTAVADIRAGLLAPATWPAVVVLSVTATAGYLTLFVVAARAAGAEAELADLLPPLVLALLAMGLPLGVGGWGPREAVSAVAFGAVGFGATQGLATAVVYGVLSLVACLPGLVVLLLHRPGRPAPATESARRREPEPAFAGRSKVAEC
jgi:uncharacterized membrane protein YbhN (UPF0104 family)